MDGPDSHNGCAPRRSQFDSTSFGLIDRAKDRDALAWRRLLTLYSPLVYYWCRQAGLACEDAADAGQEVFSAVAKAIDGFHHDQDGDTFRGWLNTITQNKVRDFLRRRRQPEPVTGGSSHQAWLVQLPADGSSVAADDSLVRPEILVCHQLLEQVHNEFEDRTWQAFWLTTINERSAGDVASELNMTATAVRKAKSRVLHRLREELANGLELSH